MPETANSVEKIKQRIRMAAESCRRNPDTVKLLAVSKTKSAEAVREAFSAGCHVFGENYIQEGSQKIEALADLDASWHFIGHLQSNKAKYAVRLFDLIHSVDSLKLAREIDKQASRTGKIQDILLQVNIGKETSKSGIPEEAAIRLAKDVSVLKNIRVKGLMTIPPFYNNPDRVRPFFKALRELAVKINGLAIPGIAAKELSMGMTGDFEAAIEEGATIVRIGTAIFGSRL